MSNNRELTRVVNFIEKEVSVSDVDEVYQAMLHLSEVAEKAQAGMDKLKAYLENNGIKPNEFFPDHKKKIIFQEGKVKTEIDPAELAQELPPKDFLKVVKVNDKALKEQITNGEALSVALKKEVGKSKDSILVKDMTKKELKEYNKE